MSPLTATNAVEHERRILLDQLANLDRIHRELAEPLMKRLCDIESTRLSPPLWIGGTVRLTDEQIRQLKVLPQTQVPAAKLEP